MLSQLTSQVLSLILMKAKNQKPNTQRFDFLVIYNHLLFWQDEYFDFSFPVLNTIPQTLFLLTFLPPALLPSTIFYFITLYTLALPTHSLFFPSCLFLLLEGSCKVKCFCPCCHLSCTRPPPPNSCNCSPLLLPRLALQLSLSLSPAACPHLSPCCLFSSFLYLCLNL